MGTVSVVAYVLWSQGSPGWTEASSPAACLVASFFGGVILADVVTERHMRWAGPGNCGSRMLRGLGYLACGTGLTSQLTACLWGRCGWWEPAETLRVRWSCQNCLFISGNYCED